MLNLSVDSKFLSFFLVHVNKKQYLCNANEVDKELLMFTQIAENFGLLYVTNS